MMRLDVTLHARSMTFAQSNMRPAALLFSYGIRDWTRIIRLPRGDLLFEGCTRDGSAPLPPCLSAETHIPAPEEGANG